MRVSTEAAAHRRRSLRGRNQGLGIGSRVGDAKGRAEWRNLSANRCRCRMTGKVEGLTEPGIVGGQTIVLGGFAIDLATRDFRIGRPVAAFLRRLQGCGKCRLVAGKQGVHSHGPLMLWIL